MIYFFPLLFLACQSITSQPFEQTVRVANEAVQQLHPDSFRYVVKTSYYNSGTGTSQYRVRILDRHGKQYGVWKDCLMTSQDFDCLNYPNARLYLACPEKKQVFSIDRNGVVTDISVKCSSVENYGEGFTALYLRKEQGKSEADIYDPSGRFLFNTSTTEFSTHYSDGVIAVNRSGRWELRDSTYQVLHQFPEYMPTIEKYPQHGLHPSANGLVRIDRAAGSYCFVDHHGRMVLDMDNVFPDDLIEHIFAPSDGIVLVKHKAYTGKKKAWTYVDTTGQRIWTSGEKEVDEAYSFKGGLACIQYMAHTLEEDQAAARAKNPIGNTFSREVKRILIDRTGKEVHAGPLAKIKFGIRQKGDLLLCATPLSTTDNRMFGYAIFDTKKQQFVFESEWPILFFDQYLVFTARETYDDQLSDKMEAYTYNKKLVWRTPGL